MNVCVCVVAILILVLAASFGLWAVLGWTLIASLTVGFFLCLLRMNRKDTPVPDRLNCAQRSVDREAV